MEKKDRSLTQILHKGTISAVLLALSFGFTWISQKSPVFSEWYSSVVYPLWVNTVGRFCSIFPFSISELLLYLLLLSFGISLVLFIIKLLRNKTRFSRLFVGIMTILEIISLLFLFYTLNCGINYQRVSFSKKTGIDTMAYTKKELLALCENLTNEINKSGILVNRNENGLCTMSNSIGKDAALSMKLLGEKFPVMDGYYPKPKQLVQSNLLSIQNLTGIYSPFTIEANYNNDMPGYNIPFTACHELSHLRGFMQEQEANFIAYLACVNSNIPEFEYSGNLVAWVYCTNVLFGLDKDAYWTLRDSLIPQARMDLTANNDFWKQYNGKVAKVSAKVNDTYLKANGQSDGVKSYNRMVDLMVAYDIYNK